MHTMHVGGVVTRAESTPSVQLLKHIQRAAVSKKWVYLLVTVPSFTLMIVTIITLIIVTIITLIIVTIITLIIVPLSH